MKRPKIFAWYLPQFHCIKENNEWWGKGFTDWVNVKKAKPLYIKHNQPRIPLNNNYYDLLDKKIIAWQAKIAKEHGVEGFCFYHYWFNGKLLLERPAEILLAEGDISINYFFSWANEPWTRAWDGYSKHVIMEQEYGGEMDWLNHFLYLLPFFNDKRYLKIDDKPVFVFYTSSKIDRCEEMMIYWNKLAKENGFKGIYFIETLKSFQKNPISSMTDMVAFLEPMYTIKYEYGWTKNIFSKLFRKIGKYEAAAYDYNKTWKKILLRDYSIYKKEIGYGAFVDWDNTPRKNKNATIIKGANPNLFGKFIKNLVRLAKKEDRSLIFINAWNEWAEGAYLEPDVNNEFEYLKRIKQL